MCRKKLPWVCVTFNLLYERERGGEGKGMGQGEGKGMGQGEGRGRGGERRNGGNKRKRRRRRKTVRSNFSRKIAQVWEQLSVPLTVSGRVGSVTS